MIRKRGDALLLSLLVMAGVAVAVVCGQRAEAPPENHVAPAEFSAQRALTLLHDVLGEAVPHPVGSQAHEHVLQALAGMLAHLGYQPKVRRDYVCGRKYPVCAPVANVSARLGGTGPALLLTAHYDSVPAGPGVADDGSGVATLLEVARALRHGAPPATPVIFLFSDAEEAGLLGAQAFVDHDPLAASVGAVLNFEARGTTGPALMFETGPHSAGLVRRFAGATDHHHSYSLMTDVYRRLPNDTDLTIYRTAGLAGLNFAFVGGVARYHTPRDDFLHLDPASVQDEGTTALALARNIRLPADAGGEDTLVFSDLLGGPLLFWPAWVSALVAVLGVLLVGAALFGLVRTGQMRRRQGFWGLAGWLLIMTALPAGAWGLGHGVAWLAGVGAPWSANPWPMRVLLWAMCFGLGGWLASRVARRAGFWGMAMAGWGVWALANLGLALLAPATGVLLLLPVGVAAVLLCAVVWLPWADTQRREVAALVACLLSLGSAGVIWFGLSLSLEAIFTPGGAAIVAIPLAMLMSVWAPLFALPANARPHRRLVLGTALAVAVVVGLNVLVVTPYSADGPAHLNFWRVQAAEGATAHWLAWGDAPSSVLGGKFRITNDPVLPWATRSLPVMAAAPVNAPGPEFDVVAREPGNDEVHIRARALSLRGAPEIRLFLPPDVSVRANGVPAHPRRRGAWQVLTLAGLGPDGVRLDIDRPGNRPLRAWLADAEPLAGHRLPVALPEWVQPRRGGHLAIIYRQVEL
ncbi:MAG: M20/M25/M40 family metallo-hydrolase [Gammaproteobacteria bacterium]